jgi:hypothetical protein
MAEAMAEDMVAVTAVAMDAVGVVAMATTAAELVAGGTSTAFASAATDAELIGARAQISYKEWVCRATGTPFYLACLFALDSKLSPRRHRLAG